MKWNIRICWVLKIKKILTETGGNIKDFQHKSSSRNIITKSEKTNIERLSAKAAYNQFDQTLGRKPSASVVLNCRYRCHN